MRIAIPLADAAGTLAERFSPTPTFAFYDVNDETRAVSYVGRQSTEQPGCGRTPAFLREHGVEVVLAHDVSENAVKHLLEAGIVAIQDAPILPSDALIAHLVSGTLQARPPLAAEGSCGGSGGCGHCGSHAHEHTTTDEVAVGTCGDHACGSHGCGSHTEAAQSCGSQGCGGHACGDHAAETTAAHPHA